MFLPDLGRELYSGCPTEILWENLRYIVEVSIEPSRVRFLPKRHNFWARGQVRTEWFNWSMKGDMGAPSGKVGGDKVFLSCIVFAFLDEERDTYFKPDTRRICSPAEAKIVTNFTLADLSRWVFKDKERQNEEASRKLLRSKSVETLALAMQNLYSMGLTNAEQLMELFVEENFNDLEDSWRSEKNLRMAIKWYNKRKAK